ncbi:MAG: helix-turn-helix transcriptional regulator [Candidatus Eremiobacteraeota bacterium]|nr:helix-turn-helix transcriptional regulator [Candidatus Eremiobacteraeota bacterium]
MKDRRLLLDLSQPDLARIAGVSLRRIQYIEAENESSNPSLRVLVQIASALKTSVPELLEPDRSRLRPTRRRATKAARKTTGH